MKSHIFVLEKANDVYSAISVRFAQCETKNREENEMNLENL